VPQAFWPQLYIESGDIGKLPRAVIDFPVEHIQILLKARIFKVCQLRRLLKRRHHKSALKRVSIETRRFLTRSDPGHNDLWPKTPEKIALNAFLAKVDAISKTR
jgi:hypothetical protein